MRMPPMLALTCLLAAGCATAPVATGGGSIVTPTRPDGTPVVCMRPPQALLDSQEGIGVAAGLPDLVQALVSSSGHNADNVGAVLRDAPTTTALDVLDYRLCLEYGKGTLSRDVYTEWLLDLRPRAYRDVHAPTGG